MNRLRQIRRIRSRISLLCWIAAWTVALVIAAGAAWVACPAWLTGGESASTTLRNLGLILAAAIGLPLAMWRSLVAERQANAARRQSDTAVQNLLNDRFQKGAEMLGNAEIGSVRIGGIHALARLAREHPDSFHIPVMELFSAFVVDRTRGETVEQVASPEDSGRLGGAEQREADAGHAERPEKATGHDDAQWSESGRAEFGELFYAAYRTVGPVPDLAKDVQEVMSQIGQRSEGQIALENKESFKINLADARLPSLICGNANFSNLNLTKADLRGVRGWDACFANALLPGANLSAANLFSADFRDADMRRVNLTAATLMRSNFANANLGFVDLV